MTEETPTADRFVHPRVRDDDARGAPAGKTTTPQPHGGSIGQPAFVPTEEQRVLVREYAKTFPPTAERYIARLIGISRDTLRKYFADDMELGRAEMLAAVGSQMIARAVDATVAQNVKRGDLQAQQFILARLGGWSTKVEMSGPDGGPVEHVSYDLSTLTNEEKRALLPVLDKLSGDAQQVDDGDT